MNQRASRHSAAAVWAAIVTVWLAWGGTYLGIKWAVETIPPVLMAAGRAFVAGAVLYAWARARGAPRPTARHWKSAAIAGFIMLVAGNAFLIWAERTVPSGLAALVVGASPLYFVVLDWWFFGGGKPGGAAAWGIAVGLLGLVILIGPDLTARGATFAGIIALLVANFGWTFGGLYSRSALLPASAPLATAMQMLAAAPVLLVASGALGEWRGFDPAQVTARSLWSMAFLIVVGSWIGYSAFTTSMRIAPTALASTYAFVNPVVAVVVGWALGGEAVGPRMLLASAVVIGGVILVTFGSRLKPQPSEG